MAYKAKETLTDRQLKFCEYYVQSGNGSQSVIKAGYSKRSAGYTATTLLKNPKVVSKIAELTRPQQERRIATGKEVMEFFTKMMYGEIKDQFGLDATNGDKIRAAQELAKRTVDVENRANGQADAKVEINLNWKRN